MTVLRRIRHHTKVWVITQSTEGTLLHPLSSHFSALLSYMLPQLLGHVKVGYVIMGVKLLVLTALIWFHSFSIGSIILALGLQSQEETMSRAAGEGKPSLPWVLALITQLLSELIREKSSGGRNEAKAGRSVAKGSQLLGHMFRRTTHQLRPWFNRKAGRQWCWGRRKGHRAVPAAGRHFKPGLEPDWLLAKVVTDTALPKAAQHSSPPLSFTRGRAGRAVLSPALQLWQGLMAADRTAWRAFANLTHLSSRTADGSGLRATFSHFPKPKQSKSSVPHHRAWETAGRKGSNFPALLQACHHISRQLLCLMPVYWVSPHISRDTTQLSDVSPLSCRLTSIYGDSSYQEVRIWGTQGLVVAQSPHYWWVGFLYILLNPCQATQHISSHKKFAAVLVQSTRGGEEVGETLSALPRECSSAPRTSSLVRKPRCG